MSFRLAPGWVNLPVMVRLGRVSVSEHDLCERGSDPVMLCQTCMQYTYAVTLFLAILQSVQVAQLMPKRTDRSDRETVSLRGPDQALFEALCHCR